MRLAKLTGLPIWLHREAPLSNSFSNDSDPAAVLAAAPLAMKQLKHCVISVKLRAEQRFEHDVLPYVPLPYTHPLRIR